MRFRVHTVCIVRNNQRGLTMIDYRDYAIELVEDNGFDAQEMLVACLKFMSQDDVREMLYANEYPNRFEEEAV
jgi:hypothetical protein